MKTRTILVVDDEEDQAGALKTVLERRGDFRVEVARNGYEALRDLASEVPAALLLAATLPDLSVAELCRAIRSRERTAFVPIIVLGERARGIGAIDALDIGADDYLAKPLNVRELEARLKAMFRRGLREPERAAARFRGVHLDADFTRITVAVDKRVVRLGANSCCCGSSSRTAIESWVVKFCWRMSGPREGSSVARWTPRSTSCGSSCPRRAVR